VSGQSLYSYVWNNPTNDVDPTGFFGETTTTQEPPVEVSGHCDIWCRGGRAATNGIVVHTGLSNHAQAQIHREAAEKYRQLAQGASQHWYGYEMSKDFFEIADKEDQLAKLLDDDLTLDADFVVELVGSLAIKKFGGTITLKGAAAAGFIGRMSKSKQYGSYTNTHASGKQYHGKGDQARSQQSGREQAALHKDPHVATDWTPSTSERESFKDEARRLRKDDNGGPRGHDSPNNYNQRASPGEKFLQNDGE